MTRISDIGANYELLPDILEEYEDLLDDVGEHLRMQGKSLEEANREHPGWQLFYDQKRAELHMLVKHFEGEVKRVTASLYKSYKENQGRNIELNERELLKWIENEPALKSVSRLLLEVRETFEKFDAVNDAFQSRGYALNNITKARIAEVSHLPI